MSDTSQTASPDGEARPCSPPRDRPRAGAGPKAERVHGYRLEIDGLGVLRCGEIRGFHEAARAAREPRAPAPTHLVLLAPEGEGWSDLDAWAEDVAQVRRRVTLERCTDGRAIVVIATLAVYGRGIETMLSIESIAGSPSAGSSLLTRSGVHRRVDIAAALAALGPAALGHAEEGPENDEPGNPWGDPWGNEAHNACFGACCREKG